MAFDIQRDQISYSPDYPFLRLRGKVGMGAMLAEIDPIPAFPCGHGKEPQQSNIVHSFDKFYTE